MSSIDLSRAFSFPKTSNLFTLARGQVAEREVIHHLYIPWDMHQDCELMYKIKNLITKHGSAYIPFMESDFSSAGLEVETEKSILSQLEQNKETHLVMTNMDSIHIYRVTGVTSDLEREDGEVENILKAIPDKHNQYGHYIKVDDLFILKVSHVGTEGDIKDYVEKFISSNLSETIFTPVKEVYISENNTHTELNSKKWIEENRNVTFDYFIRSCELEETIYMEGWEVLSRMTQHKLTLSELKRHKGILLRGEKKWESMCESFQSYYSALMHELNALYVEPLIVAMKKYESLRDVWFLVDSGLMAPEMKLLMNDLLSNKKTSIDSLEEFLFFSKNAKSFLFTLKNKFSKKIFKEEFLHIENFLIQHEALIESLICKKIGKKLSSILEIKSWIVSNQSLYNTNDLSMIKTMNLKFSHLLSMMASCSYEDNVFFRLIEEKSSRVMIQKSFDDEVKSLLEQGIRAAA